MSTSNNSTETLIPAAALVIVDKDRRRILFAQRNPRLKFLGGFHAFPGGKQDQQDSSVRIANSKDQETDADIVCAVRETFEETGLLIVRGGDKLTKGQRVSLHDDLVSGRSSFKEILDHWGLWIDGDDFHDAGVWITPKFSNLRFKTRFFFTMCPSKQTPYDAIDELCSCEFIEPGDALNRWAKQGVLLSPPVFIAFEESLKKTNSSGDFDTVEVAESLRIKSQEISGLITEVKINPHIRIIPLETKTLPPATHTNCFIVGDRKFVVVDAASPYPEEQIRLSSIVGQLIESGAECVGIVTSHLHSDHLGGEQALQKFISEKYQQSVPLITHEETAAALKDKLEFDLLIEDGHQFHLIDSQKGEFTLTALHTPGHARGHLCFYDESTGFLISCDNVLATGTVVIAPPEGNMSDYLESLRRLKELPGLKSLSGSHGTAVYDAKAKIEQYISHRLYRENQILAYLRAGKTEEEILSSIYKGLATELLPLARKTIQAHVERINEENLI